MIAKGALQPEALLRNGGSLVTEAITGIDLEREQILIAQGRALSFSQEGVQPNGHAIECRINAEHPLRFSPSPGRITRYRASGGIGIRVDSHASAGYEVPSHYDSLIAKVVAPRFHRRRL